MRCLCSIKKARPRSFKWVITASHAEWRRVVESQVADSAQPSRSASRTADMMPERTKTSEPRWTPAKCSARSSSPSGVITR